MVFVYVCCAGFSFDQKYHIRWQLSRSLTTQHLLTMVTTQATPLVNPLVITGASRVRFVQVSVTNTLMNQSVGAHVLATSSGVRKHRQSESEDSDWSDSEESQTLRDNQIRAVWSQVTSSYYCIYTSCVRIDHLTYGHWTKSIFLSPALLQYIFCAPQHNSILPLGSLTPIMYCTYPLCTLYVH